MSQPAIVRLYRLVLHLYPRPFRAEYGADMEQLLLDQLHDERAPVVIGRLIVDLAVTVPNQHLEAHLRTPNRLVPFAYLVIAVAGLVLAVLGGSEPKALVPGMVLAVGAGAIGLITWRHARSVRDSSVTAGWWKFLLAGPLLIIRVIVAAGAGIQAWFLGMGVVLAGAASFALGATLGIAHLARARTRGATA